MKMCVAAQGLTSTCKTLHIPVWSSLLLGACSAAPDEIAVTTSANQFDYLGAQPSPYGKIFDNEDGESYGVAVTAVYRLKPQEVRLVDPVRPPRIYDNFDSAGQYARNLGQETFDKMEKETTRRLEEAAKQITALADQPPAPTTKAVTYWWWILMVPLFLLAFWIGIRRKL